MATLFILNGPNLNLLGTREPGVYGNATLKDVEHLCRTTAKGLGFDIDFRQSNTEGELVNWIHEARGKAAGIVLNAGAYTHTSVALHDALKGVDVPSVEVHLSNIYKREPFRHHSFISAAVLGCICGFGPTSYELAIKGLVHHISSAGKG
jgi:3-dehydroquinate dehydratase II